MIDVRDTRPNAREYNARLLRAQRQKGEEAVSKALAPAPNRTLALALALTVTHTLALGAGEQDGRSAPARRQ